MYALIRYVGNFYLIVAYKYILDMPSLAYRYRPNSMNTNYSTPGNVLVTECVLRLKASLLQSLTTIFTLLCR